MTASAPLPIAEVLRAGFAALLARKPVLLFVLCCLAVYAAMFPVWRVDDGPRRSVFAPLGVDSGYSFSTRKGFDFYAVYNAGILVRNGATPYGKPALYLHDQLVPAPPFRYPAITAYWFGVPVSFLPAKAAYGLWFGILFTSVLGTFVFCCGLRPDVVPALATLWLLWFPAVGEYHMGQCSQALALLLFWSWQLFIRRRASFAAPWFLAMALKVFPLAMAVVFFREPMRRPVIVAVLFLALTSAILPFAWAPEVELHDEGKGMLLEGRFLSPLRLPYAGAQGLQEAINTPFWLARHGYLVGEPQDMLPPLRDPVRWATGLLIAAYGALLVSAWWRCRRSPGLELLGLCWLVWFVAFRDCWEHHYLFLQGLLALLFVHCRISWRVLVACWIFAGTPSLWWPWMELHQGAPGGIMANAAGLAYFAQRPAAVLILLWVLWRNARRRDQQAQDGSLLP